jgi:3-hydroxymyristoyl/3-hydroxydecanoyl-(acyl carrier protein) dehydratase
LLVFPADYIHFQGHFPEMKLLPAVSQVDWAMKFAHRHFGLELLMREIPRFKCMKPIFPDAPVRLELALDRAKNQLAFTYADPADGAIHSQGKIALGAPS